VSRSSAPPAGLARSGEEDKPELADLYLVAVGQHRGVDRLAVDVGAVQAADVDDDELARVAAELRVPALVDARSSRKREPALGPRLTTSRAEPAGSDSTPETGWSWAGASASERKSARKTEVVSGERSGGTPGPSFVVTSGSPPDDGLL
jgi:hypothetical protein